MNQDLFFKNFELLADAPNGVQKLRELILQLAVMGKLVPQDPNDEPASVLLDHMRNEKKRLIREKKLRKEESLPLIELKDIPFEIPETWKWVHFRDIGHIVGGGTPATSNPDYFSEEGIPWLTPADLYNLKGKFVAKGKRDISELGLQKSSAQLMPAGTVLFSSRAPIGYVAIATEDLATNQGFKSCVPFIMEMNEFIYYFLKYAGKEIDQNASGTTFKEVSGKIVSQVLFPLPPLTEQKRIVSKVDELMTLCDKLEARRQKRQEIQIKLNSAALDRMLSAENKEEFEQHWQRICENFDLLYDNPENVEKLKQAILHLAVQGKLVPQSPEDEPASILIEKIKAKKRLLIKEGKIKNTKTQTQIESQEIPYELPDKWEWIKIEDITDIGTGTTPLKSKHEYYENGSIPWITSSLTSLNYVDKPDTYITEIAVKECNLRMYPSGTLIVALYGQGKTRGQVSELRIEATINQACAAIVFIENFDSIKKYVKLFFEQKYEELRALAAGGAQPNLNVGKIKETLIPIPPLNEQKRIVEKVEQFMRLCDELESKLKREREDGEKLMEAVVRGLLDGTPAEI